MTDISFEEMQEEVYQYLLESNEPAYHEEIAAQLGMSTREVGSCLMTLYDADRVDWPSGDEWVAVAEKEMKIQTNIGTIRIEYE